jgi:hypothetical protein
LKYGLFIYEDETIYGPDKAGPKMQEIVSKHMAFNQGLGAKRIGGAGLAATATATTVRTTGGKMFGKDVAYLKRHHLVDVEARLDEDQVGALPFGCDRRHGRADAEFSCFVARRRHDTAFTGTTHGDGLAPQLRIVPLFDGSVKGVHVDVNDLALPRRRRCGFWHPRLVAVHANHRHMLRILAPTSIRTSLASCRLPATAVASGHVTLSKCCRSAAGRKRVRDA